MAVLATPNRLYPMDTRSSPSNDSQQQQQQQQQQHTLHQQQQQQMLQQQASYTYPVQQQPQGSWTPSIAATPFYPAFYQNHQQQQQQSPQPYPPQLQQQPFFDPTNAQLAAQWAYQQMMFNAQHGFPTISPQQQHQHLSPSQRSPNTPGAPDYFPQSPVFNPFPSGTPPPHTIRGGDQQNQNSQYPGFHPYRRPTRQQQQQPLPQSDHTDWRSAVPHPPYGRPDASGSTSSVNSSSSQRQRTNSNQSAHSSAHNVPSSNSSPRGSARNSPSPAASSSGSSANQSSHRIPHNRNSSSSSTSTAISVRPSSLTVAPAATAASTSTSTSTTSRMTRPSPLSQGNFTASEKRMSKDDIDLGAMHEATPTAAMIRSGGLKGRLRRALSFNANQALKEEDQSANEDDDGESIKASAFNGASSSKAKGKAGTKPTSDEAIPSPVDDTTSTTTAQTAKKKGRAASLFNSRLNASTDNISLSSTVSSASVMIRKLGAMGKLARRNSLAGITSLFKDKDKERDGDKKGKKKDKKGPFSSKGEASVASVSHVTAELDRMGGGSDWSVDSDMNGLSPAAKLARHHTLKSNAEAAAKAKATQEAEAAAAAAATVEASSKVNGINGSAGVPTWDRNTTTRQGSLSPVKGNGGIRINEDGTRTFIEEDDEDSDDGHYRGQLHSGNQSFPNPDGWDDDEDWDLDGDGDEDVTIRVGIDQKVIISEDDKYEYGKFQQQPLDEEPWAMDVRRSAERTRKPAKGILKRTFHIPLFLFI